ncbi:hypothetical protein BU16DRAFT_515789 [Lophium mytilinum]|uniref:Multicopper oxidase n=1 Tax=Lophium mytilinum TaxID=390894 RepID=A0A6A6QHB5_9PEZI|nr:hypothetical protein BU16DRAFT_515789 [Lophium mytilinum]
MPLGKPWADRTVNNTNPYDTGATPMTGMTRSYSWTVTNTTLAPDGVEIPMLVVNGQFPGPLIEANWGDWIEVTVTNGLETEGTSIHWHGFLQTGTPYEDGVPGISQCPIAPGKSFTYRFRAELYGTSWWHGHLSAQYINGLAGPIVVHGPKSNDYDIDLGPVMLSDWFHTYYTNLLEQVYYASPTGPILPPMAENMLIQGKASYNCSNTKLPCTPNAGSAQFKFTKGKKHLLRLINHSAEALIFFSIDGYNVTVIANDFVPVEPYSTDLVTIAVGQRTDIVVEATGKSTDAVWMRITEGPCCSLNDGLSFTTTAAIYYEDANTAVAPNTTSSINDSRYLFPLNCNNQPLDVTVPAYAMPVKEPSTTLSFLMTGGDNSTGQFVWWMNNITFRADWNDPELLEAKLGNAASLPIERALYDLGTNSSVRLILTSVGFPASHPMHIHGHNMQVLAEGVGSWDGSTIVNAANPQRRDTQLIQPNGYLVVQIDLNNPGVWPFHCHVAWHVSEGMNINIFEQSPTLEKEVQIPYKMAQTCRDWSAWTGTHVVSQIDSGL